ncbi:hypothetical protein BKA62DRAFT_706314 [Auriculariales sp. MPI-PUGE-AT-0066]|nr:hypothetical protein BKA62DRAFT_706314 [Auriculariales sp. MPI-PUGE-AT-0066]
MAPPQRAEGASDHYATTFRPGNTQQSLSQRQEISRVAGFIGRFRDKPLSNQEQALGQNYDVPFGVPGELTRMIGFLTGTASEDWAVILEICERAYSNEANAREATKALRREFKYSEPAAQLAAARLWAIMLRYSSEDFNAQCSSKRFLDVVEDVCTSSKTTPVVRERMLEVLAGAAYAHPASGGFGRVWRRLKHPSQPDEGIPFDDLDTMFAPPPKIPRGQASSPPVQQPSSSGARQSQNLGHDTHFKTIPVDEDVRRLHQECKIAKGNAIVLSNALALANSEDIPTNSIIKEFLRKCEQSQEFLVAQIPWATARAERSREERFEQKALTEPLHGKGPNEDAGETPEEHLLAAILEANQETLGALREYEDLERLGLKAIEEEAIRLGNIDGTSQSQTSMSDDTTGIDEIAPSSPGSSREQLKQDTYTEVPSSRQQSAQKRARMLPEVPTTVTKGLLQIPIIRSLTPPPSYSQEHAGQLRQLNLQPVSPPQLLAPPQSALLFKLPSTEAVFELPSAEAAPYVRNPARASLWTIDTFASAPSNRTIVSPDWESAPLPDIATVEEELYPDSPQNVRLPGPPVPPPVPPPPSVPLLTSLEDLPDWSSQITATAQLLLCDDFLTQATTPAEPAEVRLDPDYRNFALYQSARERIDRHRDASKRAASLKDGHEAWELIDELERRAASRREKVSLIRMVDRLVDIRYEEGGDMHAHLTAIRAALDTLVTVDMGFKVMLLLSSLPRTHSWQIFKDDLISSAADDVPLSLDDVQSTLLRHSASLERRTAP